MTYTIEKRYIGSITAYMYCYYFEQKKIQYHSLLTSEEDSQRKPFHNFGDKLIKLSIYRNLQYWIPIDFYFPSWICRYESNKWFGALVFTGIILGRLVSWELFGNREMKLGIMKRVASLYFMFLTFQNVPSICFSFLPLQNLTSQV